MNLTIKDEKALKKWKEEKHALCKAKDVFTCVDVKGEITEVVLKVNQKIGECVLNSCNETTIMVRHTDVKKMPYKINSRFATVTKQVYSMWDQMIEDSPYFVERNLNVTVYCDKAEFYEENGELYVKLTFGEYGGVVNGGHTIAAILEGIEMGFASPDGLVRIFIREYNRKVTPEEVAKTCTALNSIEKQKDYGSGEVSGYHEDFKKSLGEYAELIEWKPNEKAYEDGDAIRFDAVDTVDMAIVMAPNKDGKFSNKYGTGGHKNDPYMQFKRARDKGEVHNCEKMYPLMQDVVKLVDHIYSTFADIPKKYISNFTFTDSDMLSPISKVPVRKTLPRLVLFPILGAMSENIKFDTKTGAISTHMDFIELYDKARNKIWETLNNFQNGYGKAGWYTYCNSKMASATWEGMRKDVKYAILESNK